MRKNRHKQQFIRTTCKVLIVFLLLALFAVFLSPVLTAECRNDARRDNSEFRVSDMPEVKAIDDVALEQECVATEYAEFGFDFGYVVRVVGAECRVEPEDGIKAVCEVIANRAELYGMTPEEVVKQKVNGVRQFTDPMPDDFFDNGELVNELCLLTFACGEMWFDEPITAFCTIDCESEWHESLHYCFTIGNHSFYSFE